MSQDHPSIPSSHYLQELKKAMETWLASEHGVTRSNLLTSRAEVSRPWRLMLEAYENHEESETWMVSWCENCIPLL